VVIPIIPDENWQRVASCSPGNQAYRDFRMRLGRLSTIAARLSKEEKKLRLNLVKAAGRDKLFIPLGR
jgi:hypothetical protein